MNLQKLAETFLKLSQQTSIQPGDIADKFPEYFAPQTGAGPGTSPLEGALIQYVSSFLPDTVNATVFYIVGPGFRPSARTELTTKDGKAYQNPKMAGQINSFVVGLMKDLPQKARQRFPGITFAGTFEFGPTRIT